jgi:hypothetical protein
MKIVYTSVFFVIIKNDLKQFCGKFLAREVGFRAGYKPQRFTPDSSL